MSINIAIDGPAGAGKSTIAKKVAKNRGYIYVDTGAMYRAMALHMIRNNIAATDTAAIEEACEHADISIRYIDGEQVVLLNGENVNAYLRTEEVGNMASASSVNGKVRAKLQVLQQKLASEADVVMDGRDIGTSVLPDAEVKIYLTASSYVRAKRRFDELTAKGVKNEVFDLARSDIYEVVGKAFKYDKVVFATTTYNTDVFPKMRTFIEYLTARNFQNRKVGIVENGSWAPSAGRVMSKLLEEMKDIEIVSPMVTIRSVKKLADAETINELVNAMSK